MSDRLNENTNSLVPSESNLPTGLDTDRLNEESKDILNKLIAEQDADKTKDLTYLFNINQSKKTMVRNDKLSNLLDLMTDQATDRMTRHPEEISTQELMNGIKTIQSVITQGHDTTIADPEQTFIQINQQKTEVNVLDGIETPKSRDSRERIKNAVLGVLDNLTKEQAITADYEDKTNGDLKDD